MIYTDKKFFRKTCSGIGFLLASITLMIYATTYFFAFIPVIFGINILENNTIILFSSAIASITSMFFTSILYLYLSNTNFNNTIKTSKVKLNDLLKYISIGLSACMVANYLTTILQNVLSFVGVESSYNSDIITNNLPENILYFLTIAIIPPIVEEFAFRGVVLGKLRKYGDNFAILVSAIMFGLIHGNLQQAPAGFVIGLVLAFITIKSSSLLPAIIIHFLNNGISVITSIISNHTSVSEDTLNIVFSLFFLVFMVLAVFAIYKFSADKDYFKLSDKTNEEDNISIKEKIFLCFTSKGMVISLILILGEIALSIIVL